MSEQKHRVLVVDDFETVRMLIVKSLNDLGIHTIDQAENGEEALTMIREAQKSNTPYDLVFADWNMPVLSGMELLKSLRKDPLFKQLPFVMVTSNSDDTSVVEAMRAGVSEYLVKPFDAKSILRTVEKVLTRFRDAA